MEDGLYEIIEATENEIEQLHKLVNSAYRGEYSRKGWTTEADLLDGIRIDTEGIRELILDEKNYLFLYLEANEVLGCVNLENRNSTIYLGMLTVSPEAQAKGIGKKMLKFCESFAVENGFASIEMTVITQRKELIDWYVRYGYEFTGEKRPFPMNNPRFGKPKTELEFIVLRKMLQI